MSDERIPTRGRIILTGVLVPLLVSLLLHWFVDPTGSSWSSDELCLSGKMDTVQTLLPKLAYWCKAIGTGNVQGVKGLQVRILIELWLMTCSIVWMFVITVCMICSRFWRAEANGHKPELEERPTSSGERRILIGGYAFGLIGCLCWIFVRPIDLDLSPNAGIRLISRHWQDGVGILCQSLVATCVVPILQVKLLELLFGWSEPANCTEEHTRR